MTYQRNQSLRVDIAKAIHRCHRPRTIMASLSRPFVVIVFVCVMLGLCHKSQAQVTRNYTYNPNHLDAVKTIQAMQTPHSDLVIISAHRGLHSVPGDPTNVPGVPENSLASVIAAAQAGLEVLELDAKQTSDGQITFSHDKTWGRQARPGDGSTSFDPFTDPSSQTAVNPVVANTPYAELKANWVLRDSVSLLYPSNPEPPPLLQDVINLYKQDQIQTVLAFDIKDAKTFHLVWNEIKKETDFLGRPLSQDVVFKISGNLYPTPQAFHNDFGSDAPDINVIWIYNTSDIDPSSPFGGGEQAIINSLHSFYADTTLSTITAEITQKQTGGILNTMRTSSIAAGKSVAEFSPTGDYYAPNDATPRFFSSQDASCVVTFNGVPQVCQTLNMFYYAYPGGSPADTSDERPELSFDLSQKFNMITADQALSWAAQLQGMGLRNLSYLQESGYLGDPHCVVGSGQYPGCDANGTTVYTYCAAAESGTCSFPGYRTVAYGANGSYNYYNVKNTVACNVSTLGPDPAYGVQKACYYGPAIGSPQGQFAQPSVYCADEHGVCSFNGSAIGIFGLGGIYASVGGLQNNFPCSQSGSFAEHDPAPGFLKTCFYQLQTSGLWSGPGGYVLCANEGQTCTFAGAARIAFGAGGKFAYRTFTASSPEASAGGASCSVSEFTDPDNGVVKACYYQYATPVAFGWAGGASNPPSGGGASNNPPGGGLSNSLQSLRLMPFGDSITWGYLSSTGNGYRGPLRSELLGEFPAADFVGSQTGGNMVDPYNEGHSGYRIDQLAALATSAVNNYQPNVITLMAGTNDMNQSYQLSTAPSRLSALIDQVVAASPSATVFVSDLIPSSNSTVEANIASFNPQIPGIVQAKQAAGKKVQFVSMGAVTVNDLADSLHPNDGGYAKIADSWNSAIQQAGTGIGAAVACSSIPAGCSDPAILAGSTSGSSGNGLLPFPSHTPPALGATPSQGVATSIGTIGTGIGAPGSTIHFADMNGDGLADYVSIDPTSGALTVYLNGGGNKQAANGWLWISAGTIATGTGVGGANIRLADLNGDGKADYIIINPTTGAISAYINGGPSSSAPNGWAWYPVGQIASGVTTNAATVQFADLDGDGRADYLIVNPSTGALTAYLNIGGDTPSASGWLPLGQIASGIGAPAGSYVLFADINNDGRADYLTVSGKDGTVSVVLNEGVANNTVNWNFLGQFATGAGKPSTNLMVAVADINGDGKADYLAIKSDGAVTAWLDNGLDPTAPAAEIGWLPISNAFSGPSTKLPIVFADVNGDGRADYIVVNPATGVSQVYLNNGQAANGWSWSAIPANSPVSAPAGSVFTYADIDGDGKADFIAISPATGAITVWLNKGILNGGGISLQPLGQIASGVNPGGLTSPGDHVIFADINGDGLADYLITDPVSGQTYAWINGGASGTAWNWTPFGNPVAYATGSSGYFYFADLNSDRKADFIVVQDNAAVLGFLNGGASGASWSWNDQGQIASGVATPNVNNQDVRFADIDGDGRADYIVLNTLTGAVPTIYLNNGGDTGTLVK